MSVVKMVEAIKQIHVEDIVLIKIGKFYSAYGKDAYIMSYLFKYQLRNVEKNTKSIGFPDSSIKKVTAMLEEAKINYLTVDRRNNYEVDEKSDNKNLNNYQKYLEKAKIYVKNKEKLDDIYEYLMENISKIEIEKIIKDMEKMVCEGRKI